MADNPLIAQITLPSGTTYDIKDAKARADIQELQEYTDYLGVSSVTITDGGTEIPVISGESVTPAKGNIVNYGSKEFIYNGSVWQEFGDLSGITDLLGELAYEDADALEVTVSGTAEAQTFTGTTATLSVTITQGSVAAEGSYTPSGSVSVATSSSVTVATGVNTTTASYNVFDQAGSVTAGSAASFTQGTDTFNATVSNEVLSLSFTQGTDTFTPNEPTSVTLPTSQAVTVVTDAATAGTETINVPATFDFTGAAATISVTGSTSGVAASDIEYTPAGTNGASTVSGTGTVSIATS